VLVEPGSMKIWYEERPSSVLSAEQLLAEDRLVFTDRVIALEQQVRELQAVPIRSGSEAAAIEASYATYAALTSSVTWRAGRVVTLPVRVLRRILRLTVRVLRFGKRRVVR
jgi:hypothetical protein